jgi:hypothetical protein
MNPDEILPVIMGAFLLNILISYLIMKAAVKDATKEISNSLKFIAQLKILEMRKNEVTAEEIQDVIDSIYPPGSILK